ncbi:MAG TPA: FHA domain-containing protein [Myxococcales bacterium]
MSDHTDPDLNKGSRKLTGQPSIIVDEALDAQSEPAPSAPKKPTSIRRAASQPSRKSGGAAGDWDDLPASGPEDANATRISAVPDRRPSRGDDVDESTGAGPPYAVEVLAGPDKGIRLPIRGGRMIVGRGDGCDLKLTDTSVSRRHLELTVAAEGLVVRDLGSGNGTKVNGKREVEIAAGHGDQVALGDTVLKVIDQLKRDEDERVAAEEPEPEPEPEEQEEPEPEEEPQAPPGRRHSLKPRPRIEVGNDAEGLSDDEPLAIVKRKDDTGVMDVVPERHRPPRAAPDLFARFNALPKQARLAIMGGAGVLVLLLFFVVLTPKPQPVAPKEDPKAAVNRDADYDEARKDARKFFGERKYDKALERAKDALSAKKTSEMERLIGTIERNQEAAKALKEAKGAAARGDFDKAMDKAKEIDTDTDAGEEAKDLSKKWQEEKGKAALEKVRSAANDGDFDTARSLIAACPLTDQEMIKREIADSEVQWRRDEGRRKASAASAAQRALAARKAKERAQVDEAISPVVRKMESGDFEGAVRQCDRVAETNNDPKVQAKIKVLKKNIPGFGMAYNDGVSKFHGGSFEQAAPVLLRALSLFENMDIESKVETGLKDKTAQSLAFKGRAAATRQEYGVAARAYKEALKINPSSKEATSGLAAIKRNAEEIYNEGYAIKERDPDAARKRFQDVIDMVPTGDDWAKKAQKRIDELNGGGSIRGE